MKLLTSLLRPRAMALAAAAVAAITCGTASAQAINFIGSTSGCFDAACTPALGGLSYTNSTFNVTTTAGFASIGDAPNTPNFNNLGSFSLNGSAFSYGSHTFNLTVTFTAPPGTTPGSWLFAGPMTGSVSGVASGTDNGGIFVDFDGAHHFTFGSGATSGSFDFFVNPVSLTAPKLGDPPHTIALSGSLTAQVTSVPEPETYALFLAGLGAVGFMARRRKS